MHQMSLTRARIYYGDGQELGYFVCEVGTSREKILRFRTVLGTPMLRASVFSLGQGETTSRKTLGGAPLSPGMRWGYSCGQASYLAPTSRRLEIGLTFVLDYELRANGFDGLAPAAGARLDRL